MDVQTKAIGDGLNVNKVIYEVWHTSADGTRHLVGDGATAVKLYQASEDMVVVPDADGKKVNRASITLDLLADQHYTILFWAQVDGTHVYNTDELTAVTYNYKNAEAYAANDERLAAFYAVDFINDGVAKNSKVILKRPFAQVNLGTLNSKSEQKENDYKIDLKKSRMILDAVPTVFNTATDAVDGYQTMTFAFHDVPALTQGDETLTVNSTPYQYAGMNYVFAGANVRLTYDIKVSLNGSDEANWATVNNTIVNVPLARNHRTNIIGNLLTSKTAYEVIVDANFGDNAGNMEVVGEGIVKNINGDYEVTNERGLAYAINSLFAQGGDFYLTAELYDMTDYDVTSPSVPEGVVLNIYGETPVVTRSATVEGVTITGLKGSMIETNYGTVSFSGIKVEGTDENGETPAFIETNNGTVDFTSCETTTQDYIGENTGTVTESDNTKNEGNDIVAEDNGEYFVKVSTADELVAALEANKGALFMNDIKIEPASMSNAYGATGINVKNGQSIDGNGYTLNIKGAGGTWDSGINTTGGLIKNLTVTGSFRGIFINHNSTHSEPVVLENVTLEGVVYTISCDQGLNQNLEATNCEFYGWTSYAATIGNVKFTDCTFGAGNGYNFSRPYAPTQYVNCEFEAGHQIDPRAAVTFKNCTLDGVALTTENLSVLVTSRISNAALVTDNGLVRFANAAITNPAGVRYEGDVFENPIEGALYYNNYIFEGDATIKVENKTYGAIILENCKADINGDLITIDNDQNSVMYLQNLDITLAEGKKLIKSTNTIYQVFLVNITINGEKMDQTSIAQYLENVGWYGVYEEI